MVQLSAKGRQGTIDFDGQFVTIRREGLIARSQFGKNEKKIPLRSIQAVQWKPYKMTGWGFIQLTLAGGVERRSRLGSASTEAHKDENSVTFNKHQQEAMRTLYDALQAALGDLQSGDRSVPAPAGADELAHLASLHADGKLTDAEFTAAKARALGL